MKLLTAQHGSDTWQVAAGGAAGQDWVVTERGCGRRVSSAGQGEAGSWKCHLADTDQEGEMVDERWVEGVVARPATVHLNISAVQGGVDHNRKLYLQH